jgi:hypothetical protein
MVIGHITTDNCVADSLTIVYHDIYNGSMNSKGNSLSTCVAA